MGMMGKTLTELNEGQKLQAAARWRLVLTLHDKGASINDIAMALGVTRQRAHQLLQQAKEYFEQHAP